MKTISQNSFCEQQENIFPVNIVSSSDNDTITEIIQTQWKTDGIIQEPQDLFCAQATSVKRF